MEKQVSLQHISVKESRPANVGKISMKFVMKATVSFELAQVPRITTCHPKLITNIIETTKRIGPRNGAWVDNGRHNQTHDLRLPPDDQANKNNIYSTI